MLVLNTAIFNLTYSGGMDVPELRLNLGGKRIGPQKIAEQARRWPFRVWRGLVKSHRSTE